MGYMIGKMVVDCPLRSHGGILRAWFLVCLVNLKSLVQSLRPVTLTFPKVGNGSMRDVYGTFRKVIFRYWKPRMVILGCFHNFSILGFPLMESTDGLSVIGLQGLHCILIQSLVDLRRQEDRAIIPSN